MARKHYYGLSRKSTKNADQFFNGLFKVGKSMATAYQREAKRQQREQAKAVSAYNRLVAQNERERVRQIKQHEMAVRRAEREREKANREREKAARLQAKLQEQQRVEDEISQIEDDNFMWANVHSFIDHVVSVDDVKEAIAKCDFEQVNYSPDQLFDKECPSNASSKQQAQQEADKKFDVQKAQQEYFNASKELSDLVFNETEPTIESVTDILATEAKANIHAFLPWKQNKLRKEYILANLDSRYSNLHETWRSKKNRYEATKKVLTARVDEKNRIVTEMRQSKKDYISKRTNELYASVTESWSKERNDFYDNLRQDLRNVIDGNNDYVITAISSLFPEDELPMEYFVDFTYEEEKGKVMVDLDFPEIEDIPDRKIVLTPTGKKSIRMKGQTDLRSDYAHSVFSLAIYVAHLIFNISLKVEEIEISGFTQRKEANSAIATDQYVFVVSFTRDLFSNIDFNRLSSLQVMDFFHRHFNMTKAFDLKQIDLSSAYELMENFTPADYQTFIATLPPVKEPSYPVRKAVSSNMNKASQQINTADAPIETFEKASRFLDEFYLLIDRLSKDSGVNKHADNLNGVNIRFTSGNFKGDGNTETYRGKLFFCAIIDLYRSLERMHINLDVLTPASYPLLQIIIKIYLQENIQFSTLSKYENIYHSYINMLKPMKNGIPTPEHFYLIGEVLCDYEKDLSWYSLYLELMEKHIQIVKASIVDSSYKLKYADDFIAFHRSLCIEDNHSPQNFPDNGFNDTDMQHLDPLFKDAARLVVSSRQGSTSLIQRKFSIGYNRASRLFDQLEAFGIVGKAMGTKPREVLISNESVLENLLNTI